MIAVDTNVLIRILVDDLDHAGQMQAARELASKSGQIFIPQIVQVESVWVLRAAYALGKEDIIGVLEHMLHNQALVLQSETCFQEALTTYKSGKADFSDCLIAAESQLQATTLFTFDKTLSRLPGVELAGKRGHS